MPKVDSLRMAEFGKYIQDKYGHPLKSTSGEGKKYELKMEGPTSISHLVIQEDIAQGERVRHYRIEGKVKGKWTLLSEGSCIGHKRIELLKEPIEVSAVRLKITDSLDVPVIRNFSVFSLRMANKPLLE